jgi:sigma-B regulation protein RsbU (phosphoserine phosphatase)
MKELDIQDVNTWRVLIIEDEKDSLDLLLTFLRHAGAVVDGAENGQLGLGKVDTFQPNLILLDLTMPVLDGWKLHRILRARPSLAAIPIIAVTALVMPEDQQRVEEAGFDGYISKPFRVGEMIPRLKGLLDSFIRAAKSRRTTEMQSVNVVVE